LQSLEEDDGDRDFPLDHEGSAKVAIIGMGCTTFAEHWDKGVGVALWDAARDGLEEEGCTVVTVWVPLRNDRAMRFHELAGFKREMKTAKTTAFGAVKIEEIRLKRAV